MSKDNKKQRRWHIAAKALGQAVSDFGRAEQAEAQVCRRPRDELDKPDSTGCQHVKSLKR